MIPQLYIDQWRQIAPWVSSQQVEQDLVISRALVEIYSEDILREKLAFRGGTALHKLFFNPARRYSEDLDFIQINAEAIGDTIDLIRTRLDHWLGTPSRKFGNGLVKLVYKFNAEADNRPLKLKIEINSREHFAASKLVKIPFSLESKWFSGSASITSIRLDWLLGSKLRALYQRRKGRDLFDLYLAIEQTKVKPQEIMEAFSKHLDANQQYISRAEFEKNLYYKLRDKIFLADLPPLVTESDSFDIQLAHSFILENLICLLPGEPWNKDALE